MAKVKITTLALAITGFTVESGLTANLEELEAHNASVLEASNKALELSNARIVELETEHKGCISADEAEALKARILELETARISDVGIVSGTYNAKNKKEYCFKKGVIKFHFDKKDGKGITLIQSVDALKDAVLMEQLIALEVGFLEEVEA